MKNFSCSVPVPSVLFASFDFLYKFDCLNLFIEAEPKFFRFEWLDPLNHEDREYAFWFYVDTTNIFFLVKCCSLKES